MELDAIRARKPLSQILMWIQPMQVWFTEVLFDFQACRLPFRTGSAQDRWQACRHLIFFLPGRTSNHRHVDASSPVGCASHTVA